MGISAKYSSSLSCRPHHRRNYLVSSRNENTWEKSSEGNQVRPWRYFFVDEFVYGRYDHRRVNNTWWISQKKLSQDSHKQNMTHCMARGRNSIYNASCNPFYLLTANITHDGNGSKQVDSRLTLYKRRRFLSHRVSSDHSLFSFLVSWRENWLNYRRVLGQVTLVTFDSSFYLFRPSKQP